MKRSSWTSTTPEVRVKTTGFKGPVCLEESQFLKDLLGQEASRCLTPSFCTNGGDHREEAHQSLRLNLNQGSIP